MAAIRALLVLHLSAWRFALLQIHCYTVYSSIAVLPLLQDPTMLLERNKGKPPVTMQSFTKLVDAGKFHAGALAYAYVGAATIAEVASNKRSRSAAVQLAISCSTRDLGHSFCKHALSSDPASRNLGDPMQWACRPPQPPTRQRSCRHCRLRWAVPLASTRLAQRCQLQLPCRSLVPRALWALSVGHHCI
jgi:hypothetical protein